MSFATTALIAQKNVEFIQKTLDAEDFCFAEGRVFQIPRELRPSFNELKIGYKAFKQVFNNGAREGDFSAFRGKDTASFFWSATKGLTHHNRSGFDFLIVGSHLLNNQFLHRLIVTTLSFFPFETQKEELDIDVFMTRHFMSVDALGPHSDGTTLLATFLISRGIHSIEGGESQIYSLGGKVLFQKLLIQPLDCYFINDGKLKHGASSIKVISRDYLKLRMAVGQNGEVALDFGFEAPARDMLFIRIGKKQVKMKSRVCVIQ